MVTPTSESSLSACKRNVEVVTGIACVIPLFFFSFGELLGQSIYLITCFVAHHALPFSFLKNVCYSVLKAFSGLLNCRLCFVLR